MAMTAPWAERLTRLVEQGVLSDFDRQFVDLLRRLDPDAAPEVFLAAALCRQGVEQGHVCLELADAGLLFQAAAGQAPSWLPPAGLWARSLAASRLAGDGSRPVPLVLDQGRLYLGRYWHCETRLAAELLRRAGQRLEGREAEAARNWFREQATAIVAGLDETQRRAVVAAMERQLTIITGGPGTGKTTVVACLVALAQEWSLASQGRLLRPLLLAPTGKAAARLGQAVAARRDNLGLSPPVAAGWPDQAATIHRVLARSGRVPGGVSAELVVVDEASMVDLALMTRLFAALPPEARVVLVGDPEQLASVAAGSMLGDICMAACQDSPGGKLIRDSLVALATSYRFGRVAAIGVLLEAIREGDLGQALAVLTGREGETVALIETAGSSQQLLAREITAGFRGCLSAESPAAALARLNEFRLLCAHRHGPGGVDGLNRFCRKVLAEAGLVRPEGEWYQGRIIMVTANSYSLRLFNGDVGIVWPGADGSLAAFFAAGDSGVRSLPLARLPRHQTAFAMTIHKSQGSEFERVAVVLPRENSPLLSRELLYTAVSRARRQVRLFGSRQRLAEALGRRVRRASGLADRLAGGGQGATGTMPVQR